MSQRGQVCGRVIEPTVAFSDQRRVFLQLGIVLEENRQRAFAFAGDSLLAQLLRQRLEARIVKAFPECVIELDPEPMVDRIELHL